MAKLDSADSHFRTDPGRLPRVDYSPRNYPGMVAVKGKGVAATSSPAVSIQVQGVLMNRRWQRAECSLLPHQITSKRGVAFATKRLFFFFFGSSFTDVYFSYHKIHLIKVYNSAVFSNFIKWYNHRGKSI